MDTLSPEESSQELLTPSSQEDLTLSQEEPTPSPQEEPHVEEQDGGSPVLHCSSSTESSLHAHFEQIEDQHGEREQAEGGIDEWEVDGCQEKMKDGTESHRETEQEEQSQVQKDSMINAGSSKGSKKTSRRSGPIRVDVPPFAEFPRQPLPVPNFQSQPFSEPLRGYSTEPKSGTIHLTSASCSAVNTDMRPECQSGAQPYEETFPDSSSEACCTSYPVSESCPKIYPVTPTESDRELYNSQPTGWFQEHSEEQQSFDINHDMSSSEANPQISLHEEQRPQGSVGSRLHHYDKHSGDEAKSPDRGRSKVWRHNVEQECSEIRKEQCEVRPRLPVSDREEKPEHDSIEDRPHAVQEATNLSGDAISLAIKDIKEAIEEVKTKTVRSPYTPDKPTEPVWVMRRDVSPVEEHTLHSPSQSPPQLPSPQKTVRFQLHHIPHLDPHPRLISFRIDSWFYAILCQTSSQVLASDPVVPLGAESCRAREHQEADISPSLPTAEEVTCKLFNFCTTLMTLATLPSLLTASHFFLNIQLRRNLAAFPTYVDSKFQFQFDVMFFKISSFLLFDY